MPTLAIFLWIGSVLLDTTGRLAFKTAALTDSTGGDWQRWKVMMRSPALWAGVVSFCLEFVVYLALLSLIPLSQAILIGSINIVVVALAGRLFFHERLDATRIAGFALIAVGVALAGGFA